MEISYHHPTQVITDWPRPGSTRMRSMVQLYTMRGLARLLLIAYSLLIVKPAMPVIVDGLAHTFWRNVHIAVVHKVNGVEHVHYELFKNAKELEKEKGGAKGKVAADDAPYCTANVLPLSFKQLSRYLLPQNTLTEAFYIDTYPAHDYPPPKA